jgi:hypothetical protein
MGTETCNMQNGQDIFCRNRWWSRVEFECGRVIRAHGPDIFASSRRVELIHCRLCRNAVLPLHGPERGRPPRQAGTDGGFARGLEN